MSEIREKVKTLANPSRTWNYKGYEMRSIAEARWAAFFDICGIKWQYEPISTGSYVPDFLLFGKKPTIVEIKGGATTLAVLEEQTSYVLNELEGHWADDVVLLGANPIIGSDHWSDVSFAGIIHGYWDGGWDSSPAVFGVCEWFRYGRETCDLHNPTTQYGFRSFYCDYTLRPHGCYDGNCYAADDADVKAKWAEATNRVRYLHGGAR